jgi:hypothetical protein
VGYVGYSAALLTYIHGGVEVEFFHLENRPLLDPSGPPHTTITDSAAMKTLLGFVHHEI